MSTFINHNGIISRAVSVTTDLYTNGLFETMKIKDGKLLLADYHFDRLFSGLSLLGFSIPVKLNPNSFIKEIDQLQEKNECAGNARIRLTVSKSKILNSNLDYTIECFHLERYLNTKKLMIGLYDHERKQIDGHSHLKSTSRSIYNMAGLHARENNWDDCLVLNSSGNICDSSIANVFWIKNRNIFTPPLSEGCIAGVVRRYLMEEWSVINGPGNLIAKSLQERIMTIEELGQADEVFLTNAIRGIQAVLQFRETKYTDAITKQISHRFINKKLKE